MQDWMPREAVASDSTRQTRLMRGQGTICWKKLWFDAVVKLHASNFWAKRPTVQMQLTAWMSNNHRPFWLGLAGLSGQCRHLMQCEGGSPGPTSRGFSHCDSMSLRALF